jgi:hydrogenase maturation protease
MGYPLYPSPFVRDTSSPEGQMCRAGRRPAPIEGGVALKTVIVGLGNPILTDDGIGIHVIRAVKSRLAHAEISASSSQLSLVEASVGGLRLLDILAGHGRAIVVDAIQTRDGEPGKVYRLHPNDLKASRHSGSTHDLTLSGALALGRRLGLDLPQDRDLVILAVEVEDVLTFGEECTPPVAAAIPGVAQMVLDEIVSFDGERADP